MKGMNKDAVYSREELAAMIPKMNEASHAFYGAAAGIGCHPFIEFNGLMNEWIKMARNSLEEGVDFTQANVHSGIPLVAQDYEIKYFCEKFECIFGPVLSVPKNREIFCLAMGWNDLVAKEDRSAAPITTNVVTAQQ